MEGTTFQVGKSQADFQQNGRNTITIYGYRDCTTVIVLISGDESSVSDMQISTFDRWPFVFGTVVPATAVVTSSQTIEGRTQRSAIEKAIFTYLKFVLNSPGPGRGRSEDSR